jgi:hypothetical protein
MYIHMQISLIPTPLVNIHNVGVAWVRGYMYMQMYNNIITFSTFRSAPHQDLVLWMDEVNNSNAVRTQQLRIIA